MEWWNTGFRGRFRGGRKRAGNGPAACTTAALRKAVDYGLAITAMHSGREKETGVPSGVHASPWLSFAPILFSASSLGGSSVGRVHDC